MIMRIPLLILLLVVVVVNGWTTRLGRAPPTFTSSSSRVLLASTSDTTTKETTDDYDDWYADFDPSDYENVETSNTGSKRSSTGSSFSGGGSHDYTRDSNADDSNVDLKTIDGLISERLEYRKTGRYDEADELRDVLLKDHGVAIFDREKTWRSGCSGSGGSGMKWRPNQNSRGGRNSRNFGPNGHDYNLAEGAGPNTSSLKEEEIHSLLAERLESKMSRDFQTADEIQDTLIQAGVFVHDRTKEWRADGESFRDGGARGEDGRPSRGPSRNKALNFGPNGHDYNLAQDAGPNTSSLQEEEIHSLLAERLEYKMSRDFQSADAIQDTLIQAGVSVHDGNKEWRADGQGFGDGPRRDDGRPSRNSNSRNQPYQRSPHSLPVEDATTIQDLVDERMDAKRVRDYHVADDIRDELRAEFNVEVNDKLRQWSVGGEFGIPQREARNYVISPDSETPENADEIQKLVEERNEARKIRDFDTADGIREDLMLQNVMIDDKLCQWAVGGRFSNARVSPTAPFTKRGDGGDLTEDDEALVVKLIEDRSAAQRDKEYGKADRIRDRLEADFKVRVDDRSREWHVVSEKYAMIPEMELDDDIRNLIEARLVERAVAKLEKDYETADAIRDELTEQYNVDIDDRVREWRIVGGLPATDLDDSVFDVDEADFEVDDEEEIDDAEEEGEEDVEEETSMEIEDLTSLTIPELKIRLKEAGLPVSGKKAELIERLTS